MLSVASFRVATFVKSSDATTNVGSPTGTKNIPLSSVTTRALNVRSYTTVAFASSAVHSVSQFAKTPQVTTALTSSTETGVEPTFASTVKPTITSSVNGKYVVITEIMVTTSLRSVVQYCNKIKIQLILKFRPCLITNSEIHFHVWCCSLSFFIRQMILLFTIRQTCDLASLSFSFPSLPVSVD